MALELLADFEVNESAEAIIERQIGRAVRAVNERRSAIEDVIAPDRQGRAVQQFIVPAGRSGSRNSSLSILGFRDDRSSFDVPLPELIGETHIDGEVVFDGSEGALIAVLRILTDGI